MDPQNSQAALRLNKIVIKKIKRHANGLLTNREFEILQFLKKGYFNREVSNELHISIETVKKHIYNIYFKLDVRNKTEALNKLFN